ncbi:MAG: hypothetical protein Q4D82_02325 [Neisseria sp.]|nr:hypothetical protein [Neisseria sp.]
MTPKQQLKTWIDWLTIMILLGYVAMFLVAIPIAYIVFFVL